MSWSIDKLPHTHSQSHMYSHVYKLNMFNILLICKILFSFVCFFFITLCVHMLDGLVALHIGTLVVRLVNFMDKGIWIFRDKHLDQCSLKTYFWNFKKIDLHRAKEILKCKIKSCLKWKFPKSYPREYRYKHVHWI